jgi:hypothetical protein
MGSLVACSTSTPTWNTRASFLLRRFQQEDMTEHAPHAPCIACLHDTRTCTPVLPTPCDRRTCIMLLPGLDPRPASIFLPRDPQKNCLMNSRKIGRKYYYNGTNIHKCQQQTSGLIHKQATPTTTNFQTKIEAGIINLSAADSIFFAPQSLLRYETSNLRVRSEVEAPNRQESRKAL